MTILVILLDSILVYTNVLVLGMVDHSFTAQCQRGLKQIQRGQVGGGEKSPISSGLIVCLVFFFFDTVVFLLTMCSFYD